MNEEATRVTGYSRKHLINSRFKDYFTEPERARAGVEQTLEEKRVLGYELTLITRYGRRITVEFLHKLRDEERYADLDTLTRQIRADAEQARAYFATNRPCPTIPSTTTSPR